ncbi:MAG: hypothetical protein IIA72_12690 [Proteobacteria bacterium]|nr:hypothetical protein [Pseudomonadota bacterium]
MRRFMWFSVLLSALTVATSVGAQDSSTVSKKERLIMDVPKGWYLGSNSKNEFMERFEFVPEGQTVQNWTDMISIGIFPLSNVQSPNVFAPTEVFGRAKAAQRFATNWRKGLEETCEDTQAEPEKLTLVAMHWAILDGKLECTKGKVTGKGEVILYRFIFGRDGNTVVMRQRGVPPFDIGQEPISSEVLRDWKNRLKQVRHCDPRLSNCPSSQFSF